MRERDGLGFDAAAADGAGKEAGGGDEHFCPGVLRGAAEGVDQNDEHERSRVAFEGGELFVEGGGFGRHGGRWRLFAHGLRTRGELIGAGDRGLRGFEADVAKFEGNAFKLETDAAGTR